MVARLSAGVFALCLLFAPAFAQGAKPTDPQIAHIAYTAGQLDIEAAKQALANSKNKEVRAFANDMVRDHAAVNKQALALVKKLNVTPEDNDTSQALTKAGCGQARRAREAQRRGIRQGLCRQRGRLPQDRERRARKHAHSLGEQCRAQEPAADRPEDSSRATSSTPSMLPPTSSNRSRAMTLGRIAVLTVVCAVVAPRRRPRLSRSRSTSSSLRRPR